MTIPNVSYAPVVWTAQRLDEHALRALDEFVDRRLAEPTGKYLAHFVQRRGAAFRLFKTLAGVDPLNPDPETIRAILRDEAQFDALRYVAGPPISRDDLGVLVTRSVQGLGKREIDDTDHIPIDILTLICRLADPIRFPWIARREAPSRRAIRSAVESTAAIHAIQALQTERRGHGRIVEEHLQDRLVALGFVKLSGQTQRLRQKQNQSATRVLAYPPGGRVTQPSHHPAYPHFYGECTVYGRKVDLFIALATGRMIALEAKDSSSALNSTKRLLNDTAAKAKHYATEAGNNIISVALLSGVFKVPDLVAAQKAGLYLVWAHELDGFIEWIRSQI